MTRSMASTDWIVVAVGDVDRRAGGSGQREHASRARQMRSVEHLALVGYDAGAAGGSERRHDGLRRGDGRRRGLECLIQHGDLVRMDRELAGEAVALRGE